MLVTFGVTANSTVRSLAIAKDTRFTTSVNGASYIFVTPEAYTIAADDTNRFSGYITITEGTPLTHRFTYSAANSFLTIPNANTDVDSITVNVTTSGSVVPYTKADDIFVVGATAKVFFVDADAKSKYRISFGDGVLGAQPAFGSTVAVSYRTCSAAKTNGANTFTAVGSIAAQSNFTLFTADRATGGSEQEPIESVRFNAPRMYETQNRAVTSSDYQRIILRDNPSLQGVNVWGGEDNIPPIYGKVFISVKPNSGMVIGTTQKERIKSMLRKYNVQSISPEFVDATFLYITPSIVVNYDPTSIVGTASDIASSVASTVASYEANVLNRFDGKFRASKFLEAIDNSDTSIVGSTLSLTLSKRFVPDITRSSSYTFMFNHQFNLPNPGYKYAISSSEFTYKGESAYLDDDGYGVLRVYYQNSDGSRTYVTSTSGTVNYLTGQIDLINFAPSAFSGAEITITAEPSVSEYNVIPIRNQILLLRDSKVHVKNDSTGLREINNWAITTLGTSASVLAPSYSSSVVY